MRARSAADRSRRPSRSKLPPRWPSVASVGLSEHASWRIHPSHVEPGVALHLDPRVPVADVALGDGEDQVAELAEPGVGPQARVLRAVELDREPAERDRGRCAALCAHHTRRATRRSLAGQVLLQDDDPLRATRGGEPRRPPADHAGADDHQVRTLRPRHRSLRPTWGVSVAPAGVRPARSCGSSTAPRAAPRPRRIGVSPRTPATSSVRRSRPARASPRSPATCP